MYTYIYLYKNNKHIHFLLNEEELSTTADTAWLICHCRSSRRSSIWLQSHQMPRRLQLRLFGWNFVSPENYSSKGFPLIKLLRLVVVWFFLKVNCWSINKKPPQGSWGKQSLTALVPKKLKLQKTAGRSTLLLWNG